MILRKVQEFSDKRESVSALLESKSDSFYLYHIKENCEYEYLVIYQGKETHKIMKLSIPDLSVALIHNGTIIGKCGVCTSSNFLVKESLPPWLVIDKIEDNVGVIETTCNVKRVGNSFDLKSQDTIKVEDTVVVVSSYSDGAFSHFFFESFSKLHIINDQFLLKSPNVKWVVNENIKDYQLEALLSLGIPFGNIIKKKYTQNIKAERVVLIESPAHNTLWATKESLYFLKRFFKHIAINDDSLRATNRIYVDRKDDRSAFRRIVNESKLLPIAKDLGFESFTLGKLPLNKKYTLYRKANYIVGQYGGGMMLAFLSDELKGCVVMQSPYFYRGVIDFCSSVFGFKVVNIMGSRSADTPLIDSKLQPTERQNLPFTVGPSDLKEAIIKITGQSNENIQ